MKYLLKIDRDIRLDKLNFLEDYKKAIKYVLEGFGYKLDKILVNPSSSGRGLHIFVWFYSNKKLDKMDICRLQLLCGDDETRSEINYRRIKRGMLMWNKLFGKVLWKKEVDKKCRECKLIRILKEIKEEDEKGL